LALCFGSASIQRLAIRAPRFSVFDDSSPDHKSHLMGLVAKVPIGFDAHRAVVPLSMETAEKKLAGEPSVARFIIPLGATINTDGTALYQVAAAFFLTQVFWGASRHLGPDRPCGHCGRRIDWNTQHATECSPGSRNAIGLEDGFLLCREFAFFTHG
jgi:hypothetical protein